MLRKEETLTFKLYHDDFWIDDIEVLNTSTATQDALDALFIDDVPLDFFGKLIELRLGGKVVATINYSKPEVTVIYKNIKEIEYDLF